jgi:hypothetical protein
MQDDFIEIAEPMTMADLIELGQATMTAAVFNGGVEFTPGVWLYPNETLIARQQTLPAKERGSCIDFTQAPFYIFVDDHQGGYTASPCREPMEVIDFLDIEPSPRARRNKGRVTA